MTYRRTSYGVQSRRAFSLVLLTLVAPGAAQRIAGGGRRRTIGRYALRCYVGLVMSVLFCFGLAVLFPGPMVSVFTSEGVLDVVRLGLLLVAIGWAGLFIDCLVLADPMTLPRRQRLIVSGLALGSASVVAWLLLTGAHYAGVAGDAIAAVFQSDRVADLNDNRYTIALLGSDGGDSRMGQRPDSLMVLSIDADTGEAVLFGLPRNLQRVPFPAGSPMRGAWPDGFDCGVDCLLNAVYTWAYDNAASLEGASLAAGGGRRAALYRDDPGIAATRDAFEAITGLAIDYHVMIDMGGFEELIDALGGVTIRLDTDLPVGPLHDPHQQVIEAGEHHLDGEEALLYARARSADSDYARMARQRCVLGAMSAQLDPGTVLSRFEAIARSSAHLIRTDIPASELGTLVTLAGNARQHGVKSVQFVPPLITTADPDFGLIRRVVRESLGAGGRTEPAQVAAGARGTDDAESGDGDRDTEPAEPEDTGDRGDSDEANATDEVVADIGRACSG